MAKNSRNGLIIRFPLSPKSIKNPTAFSVPFLQFCTSKVEEGLKLGFKCFIFELSDTDFSVLDFRITEGKEKLKLMLEENGARISFYLKTKKHVTGDDPMEVALACDEILICCNFLEELDLKPQEASIITHIGGAKGDRKASMEKFCETVESKLTSSNISYLAVINDDKPSLFSVKDLLPGIFYRLNIPIVFRSTSYPTNQGNLTLNESLFLAASTWKREHNPIFIYLPSKVELKEEQTRPFGLELDIVFDNKLPE